MDGRGLRPGDILVAANGKVSGHSAMVACHGGVHAAELALCATGGACLVSMLCWVSTLQQRGDCMLRAAALCCMSCRACSWHPGLAFCLLPTPAKQTVEVNNTDAEGRLTLADAMLFAQNQCGVGERREGKRGAAAATTAAAAAPGPAMVVLSVK